MLTGKIRQNMTLNADKITNTTLILHDVLIIRSQETCFIKNTAKVFTLNLLYMC